MLIAALFTIAKTWKQTKCSSTVKWIKKIKNDEEDIVHIYNAHIIQL